ncbi:MAG: YkvA family protein [Erysipelotrichaceae bacterium]|nr:YkvA family protein [Erysipelotrichaceae bacterium]MDO5109234.1 YkvA family protein [Erysipelotrichaceae bacterium]
MADEFNVEKAKEVLEDGMNQAQELIQDPSKIKDLLAQVEEKIKEIPVIGTDLANLPEMVSMIRSYITKEYEASPKVVAAAVSALLYLVKRKDLIPDNIPILGRIDDIGVIAAAAKLCGPEIEAYKQWKENKA